MAKSFALVEFLRAAFPDREMFTEMHLESAHLHVNTQAKFPLPEISRALEMPVGSFEISSHKSPEYDNQRSIFVTPLCDAREVPCITISYDESETELVGMSLFTMMESQVGPDRMAKKLYPSRAEELEEIEQDVNQAFAIIKELKYAIGKGKTTFVDIEREEGHER